MARVLDFQEYRSQRRNSHRRRCFEVANDSSRTYPDSRGDSKQGCRPGGSDNETWAYALVQQATNLLRAPEYERVRWLLEDCAGMLANRQVPNRHFIS